MGNLSSLKNKSQFYEVFKFGKKKKSDHFSAFFLTTNIPETRRTKHNISFILKKEKLQFDSFKIRFGLIISKRNVKKNVSRNLIKRWIKELLRQTPMFADIIIKANSPILTATKSEKNKIFNELKSLLLSISECSVNKNSREN